LCCRQTACSGVCVVTAGCSRVQQPWRQQQTVVSCRTDYIAVPHPPRKSSLGNFIWNGATLLLYLSSLQAPLQNTHNTTVNPKHTLSLPYPFCLHTTLTCLSYSLSQSSLQAPLSAAGSNRYRSSTSTLAQSWQDTSCLQRGRQAGTHQAAAAAAGTSSG
jgi:hypothetical protein